MRRVCCYVLIGGILMLTGCFGRTIPHTIEHIYKISVVDGETKQPVPDAFLSCEIEEKQVTRTTGKTGGQAVVTLVASPEYWGRSVNFKSSIPFIVSAPGYSVVIGRLKKSSSWQYGDPVKKILEEQISIFKCPHCIDNAPFIKYAESFTSTIQSDAKFNELALNYIYSVIFQRDCYLSLYFTSTLKFNDNRVTDYDVAKYLLTSIFEIMRPSRPAFEQDYNFAFTVNTTIENFSSGSSVRRPLKIEYYIPAYAAQAFMDRLITRQQLVDRSKVFINDGKVDLRFQ